MKVMVIEDEPNAMERYSSYIASYSDAFTIVAKATTYDQAVSLFSRTDPDVIFSDVVIPGNSGLSFLEHIRQRGWHGMAVIISGYGDFSFAQQAIKLAVFDYLLKPVFQKDLEQLLDKILTATEQREPDIAEESDTNLPRHIKRAKEYVRMNYNREVSLGATAAFAHVSPAYLSASFTKKCNMTFVEYLQTYRSKLAAKLLCDTDLTLEEIADRVGFGDSSYLNRCFKKYYRICPGQYRREQQAGQGHA